MEMNYTEYIGYINKLLQSETIQHSADNTKPLGKFIMLDTGRWRPLYYPGFTLITPTLEDDLENAETYRKLLEVKGFMLPRLNPDKFVEAPDQALHMTVARLVSGNEFETRSTENYEVLFSNQMKEVFSKLAISGRLRFEIRGISMFHQVIAAMVSPVNEADYNCLQNFREFVYSDRELQEFGVERKRGFKGHISLFYIEKELETDEKQSLKDDIIKLNSQFFEKPLPFYISRAEVRRFNNFLRFCREENGPVFEFI